MPIASKDIDPAIQSAIQERMSQIFAQGAALDPMGARVRAEGTRAWKQQARKHASQFWMGAACFGLSLLVAAIGSGMGANGEGLAVLGFLATNGVGFGLIANAFIKTQRTLTRYANADVLRYARELVALSRAEQLYCEAVAALIDAGPMLGDTLQQEILQQLNGLLDSHRKLEAPLRKHRAGSAGASPEALQQELTDLQQRLATQHDPSARQMMEQSIALCSARLEHARAIEPAREKGEAQQELILQSLASVQAGLARVSVAGAAPPPAEVEELSHSVTQINRQARAVEEAVLEVMARG